MQIDFQLGGNKIKVTLNWQYL